MTEFAQGYFVGSFMALISIIIGWSIAYYMN